MIGCLILVTELLLESVLVVALLELFADLLTRLAFLPLLQSTYFFLPERALALLATLEAFVQGFSRAMLVD